MEGTEFTIKVTPEGSIIALYREDLPVWIEGRKEMARASNVLWNQGTQKWEVHLNIVSDTHDAKETTSIMVRDFKLRSEAIRWEIDFLEKALADGYEAEKMFPE